MPYQNLFCIIPVSVSCSLLVEKKLLLWMISSGDKRIRAGVTLSISQWYKYTVMYGENRCVHMIKQVHSGVQWFWPFSKIKIVHAFLDKDWNP